MAAVKMGTRFRAVIADANAEWEVTAKLGRGVWEATCIDEDYGGSTRAFRTRDITASQAIDKMFADNLRSHDDFYAGLELGSTVHYHNGFGNFVRCEVVEDDGKRKLKPVALVGTWRDYDLGPDNHYPRKIEAGEPMEPNASNVYENPEASVATRHDDPRNMEAIRLAGAQLALGLG